ncbi:hypothetical protein Bca4012_002616 [Brassica carinata]
MAAVDSLQLNALSLPTWAVHVSSVVEWITAMALAERCTYGERILGSSSEYVQSNITRYFSDPQYYFKVNDQYVTNKLKVVLFPFLHRTFSEQPLSKTSSCFTSNDQGHWARISELVGGVGSHTSLPSMISMRQTCTFPLWHLVHTLFLLVFHWDLMESKFLYMTLCISLSVLSLRGSMIDGH